MERTELLSYNINVELKAFASVPDKDLIVQTFCDVLLGADPTIVVHTVHIQNNGTVRLWIDTDAIPSGSSRIIHRIFVKRELFADVCQHTDQKREEKKHEHKMPHRPVRALVAVWEVHPVALFNQTAFEIRDSRHKVAVGRAVVSDLKFHGPDGPKILKNWTGVTPSADEWAIQMANATTRTEMALVKAHSLIQETNITELRRFAFANVDTPSGRVPEWLWVYSALAHKRAPSNEQVEHWLEIARLLTRKPDVGPSDAVVNLEVSTTSVCLVARHMAYFKDSIKSPETLKDSTSDFWTYPWHSADMRHQEIDCEDGAILTLAISQGISNGRRALNSGFGPFYQDAFVIMTLRPQTECSSSAPWTYHAVCMRFSRLWLMDKLIRAVSKNPEERARLELKHLQASGVAAVIMDATANHECVWKDKASNDPGYFIQDAAAVPPEAAAFALHRDSWQDVRDAHIYGHVQSVILPFDWLQGHSGPGSDLIRDIHQFDFVWEDRLGVSIEDLMDPERALSHDLRVNPVKLGFERAEMEELVRLFNQRQPQFDIFPPIKQLKGAQILSATLSPKLIKAQLQESGHYAPGETSFTVESFVQPGDAVFTVRGADFTPELLEATKRHNKGKDVFHLTLTLIGEVEAEMIVIRNR